jgi:hypothetical protein
MIFSRKEWLDNEMKFISKVEAWKMKSPRGTHEGRCTGYSSDNPKNEIIVNVKCKLREENNQDT